MARRPNPTSKEFAQNLGAWIKFHGYSRSGFANALSECVRKCIQLRLFPVPPRVSPGAVARWMEGRIPDPPQLRALCGFLRFKESLVELSRSHLELAGLHKLEADILSLAPDRFESIYLARQATVGAVGTRFFFYALYSPEIVKDRGSEDGTSLGSIGRFSISGVAGQRRVEGLVYHYFGNRRKRLRGVWDSTKVSELPDELEIWYRLKNERPQSAADARGHEGVVLLKSAVAASQSHRPRFEGKFHNTWPVSRTHYRGAMYAEELSAGDYERYLGSLEDFADELLGMARETFSRLREELDYSIDEP